MADVKPNLSPAETARKRRNVAIAVGLLLFAALTFLVTLVKLGMNAAQGGGA